MIENMIAATDTKIIRMKTIIIIVFSKNMITPCGCGLSVLAYEMESPRGHCDHRWSGLILCLVGIYNFIHFPFPNF